jgi:hypothetical protein
MRTLTHTPRRTGPPAPLRQRWRRRAVGVALVATSLAAVAAVPAPLQAQVDGCGDPLATSPALELLGHNDLGGEGLNGEVTVIGDIAVVASGIMPGGGLRTGFYNPYPCPATTTDVVDISDPANPTVVGGIPVVAGVTARDVDAIEVATPSFTGTLLGVALARCSGAGNLVDRGVEYYDLNDPANPVLLGRYDADLELFAEGVECENSSGRACASSQDSVSLSQRPDGTVLSISTEPFASASRFASGDLRVVDVTDPTNPVQIGDYDPPLSPGDPSLGFSNNGCRPFTSIYTAELYAQGTKALAAGFDDGLFDLGIDPPPGPPAFGTDPVATLLGQVDPYPQNNRLTEGNNAYVTFAGDAERPLGLMSDEDWIAPATKLWVATVNGSRSGVSEQGLRPSINVGCEAMFTLFDPEDTAQIYRHTDAQVPPGKGSTAPFVYVGFGCAGAPLATDPLTGAPADVTGKIAVADRGVCGFADKAANLQSLGAIGVLNAGAFFGNAFSPDGDPTPGTAELHIPVMTTNQAAFDALKATLIAGGTATGAMVDRPGFWGGLRVADLTSYQQVGGYTTPRSRVFPPPDLGVYSVHHAVAEGDRAQVAWNSDGLRVLDLANPASPSEVGHFVPPDTPDPTGQIPAKAYVVGVDTAGCNVVISDINSGLYVVSDPGACPGG